MLYDGEVCLGSAPVVAVGPSLFELGRALPPDFVLLPDSVHMQHLAQQQQQQQAAGYNSMA